MNRHATTEQLSAYLDRELGFVELRQVEAHCASCVECYARLTSMRRVVQGLDRVGRAVPPAALRQQIRRQVAVEAAAPANGFRAAFERFRLHLLALQSTLGTASTMSLAPPQPSLRTASVMGLALVVGLFVYSHQTPPPVAGTPQEIVTVGAYLDTPVSQTTTSEVAGRKFIWTDSGWIQRGLEGKTPETQVEAASPQGRALLSRYSDLAILLADGSPVILRYNLGTVEIRKDPPTRVLGYEGDVRPGQVLET